VGERQRHDRRGAVAESLDWHWIFWLNVPIGLALIPVALLGMAESHGPRGRLDPLGLGLVSAGVLGVVWGLVRGDAAGWGSAEVTGALAAGAVLLGLFLGWEWRAPAPMVPLGFFRARAFSAGNAAIFLAVASLFCAVFFLAQYMQVALGSGPLEAGLRLLPWTGTLFVVAPAAGALVDRFGERPFLVAGTLLHAGGMAWLAFLAERGAAYAAMVAPLIVAGVGISMCFPSAQNSVVSAVPPEAIGTAAGVNSDARAGRGVRRRDRRGRVRGGRERRHAGRLRGRRRRGAVGVDRSRDTGGRGRGGAAGPPSGILHVGTSGGDDT